MRNNVSKIDFEYAHFEKGDMISRVHSYGVGDRTDLPNNTISYSYNSSAERVLMETVKGAFSYQRDSAGRLRQVINHKGETFAFKYDLNQRLKEVSSPVSITSFSFDTTGFNTQIEHKKKSGALIDRVIYGRDALGNRTSRTNGDGVANFGYDKNSQLVSATIPNLADEFFTYDSIGNRASDSLLNYEYDSSKQLLQRDTRYRYSYDVLGNLISKDDNVITGSGERFYYNSENQLIRFVKLAEGNVILEAIYTYDPLGRRIEKRITNYEDQSLSKVKRFSYDGSEILFEYNEDNTIINTFTHSSLKTDDVLSISTESGSYFYAKDGLGSVTEILGKDGALVQSYKYSSFGILEKIKNAQNEEVTTNPPLNQFYTFTGREFDSESGLYFYRGRYYDAKIGRFIQGDIDPGKLKDPSSFNSKYAYVLNNPLIYNDPEGKSANLSIGNTIDFSFGFSQGTNVRLHPVYGSYCGPYSNDGKDFSAPAKDGPDSVCKNHDQNYAGAESYSSRHWNSGNFFSPELAAISETGHYFYHRLLADGELIFEMFNHNSWKNRHGHHDVAQFTVAMGTAAFFTWKYIKMGDTGFNGFDYLLFGIDKQGMISRYYKKSLKRLGL